MNASVLGLVISMVNIQSFGGPKKQIQDLIVNVDDVYTLKQNLEQTQGLSIDVFRKSNFFREGDRAIYISNIVHQYLFGGNVDPDEEGIMIEFVYEPRNSPIVKGKIKDADHLLVRHDGLREDVAKTVLRYIGDTVGRGKIK